jgi:flagellar biosynthesis chaperone FliJ
MTEQQQELESLLHEKIDAYETAVDGQKPQDQVSSLYKEIKELQYQLTLLRNNLPISA